MQLGNEKLSIETGKVAKQSDGAAWVQYGGTVVLVTVVASKQATNLDFFPLTVDYRERGYANGRIPPVYGRREPRPGDTEQLTARLINHCIRPLFPKDFKKIQTPTGIAMFPAEMSTWPPKSYLDRMFNVKQLTKMSKGGHFAAMEKPDLLIQDVTKFARTIR